MWWLMGWRYCIPLHAKVEATRKVRSQMKPPKIGSCAAMTHPDIRGRWTYFKRTLHYEIHRVNILFCNAHHPCVSQGSRLGLLNYRVRMLDTMRSQWHREETPGLTRRLKAITVIVQSMVWCLVYHARIVGKVISKTYMSHERHRTCVHFICVSHHTYYMALVSGVLLC